ncbi:ABC transporter ATP-binding protein [Clostridium hydrogenum]|uniref:ABC transporter ATP-binding protein n=1 Tax=Clostridium hydrogenum TaxID=2855764 RepID=UPI001F238DC1|nr:ABC transporter ATP-binding protein [Clostridium hydrogenum]
MLKVFKYFKKKEKMFVFISMIFILLQVWLDLKLPDYMSQITTLVETKGSSMMDILTQGGYMVLCAIFSMAASMIVGYFAAVVAAGLSKTLRGMVYDKTLSFSMEEINKFSTASLINRTTNDITQVQTLVAMGLQIIIKAPILAVWAVIKISGKSWQWTSATAVAVFILIIMLGIILIFAVPRFKVIQSLSDNLNRIVREHLTGIRVVRAYNAEKYQEDKFEKSNDELTNTNLVAYRVMAIMSPGMTLINSGLSLVVYWIGAYIINSAGMGDKIKLFSNMIVFSSYAMQVIMAFMLLNMIFILLPRAQVSAKRIIEVLTTETKLYDGTVESIKDETINFKHVYFKYPDASDYVLKDINFKAKKGQTVAFIGSTGSGKSTLVNLVPRFYDASKGEITIGGINIKEYKQEELHNKIGYVPQKAVMFSGTVSSNVMYGDNGKEKASKSDIVKAIDIAQSTDFVKKMKDSYDAPIAQGGTNISGGQKQRLAIARAICRKPQIFIFDDSFSALDYKTDRDLRSRLKAETKNAITLIVGQRIGTIKDADMIIVLDKGEIVGKGTHEQLLENCSTYKEIALSQLSKEELVNG